MPAFLKKLSFLLLFSITLQAIAKETNHYATLEVATSISDADLKKAYRKLALQWHPDRNPGNKEAEEKFKDLGNAWEVLGNSEYRKHYDAFFQQHNRISANGNNLEGAYKDNVSGEEIDLTDYYTSSGLNLNKKVSKFLKQSNAKPTDALMSLDSSRVSSEFQAKERKLTDQLFHILIADVLFGQYDRYSGSNFVVRVSPEDSSVEFFAKDNGGTYLIPGYTTRNLHALRDNWFNRYNKETMDTLIALYKFLNGDAEEFEGFTDKLEFASALGLKFTRTNGADTAATNISAQLSTFKTNLEKLLQKYNSDLAAGGENTYY